MGEFNDTALMGGPSGPSLLHEGYPASVSNLSATATPTPAIGGSVIGGSHGFPSSPNGSSSSALASILGISLPTGSGSLQESSSLWFSAPSAQVPQEAPSHLSGLNGGTVAPQDFYGNRQAPTGSSLIGGVPIGASSAGGAGSNLNDITLLQSLLPGVHISSGSDGISFGGGGGIGAAFGGQAGGSGWATAAPGPVPSFGLGSSDLPVAGGWHSSGGYAHSSIGPSIGAIGHDVGVPPDQRRDPGIW
jgi:hypothetical protein